MDHNNTWGYGKGAGDDELEDIIHFVFDRAIQFNPETQAKRNGIARKALKLVKEKKIVLSEENLRFMAMDHIQQSTMYVPISDPEGKDLVGLRGEVDLSDENDLRNTDKWMSLTQKIRKISVPWHRSHTYHGNLWSMREKEGSFPGIIARMLQRRQRELRQSWKF